MKKTTRLAALAAALALGASLFSGCGQQPVKAKNGTAENEIITFTSNPENKPIIRIGTQYYVSDTNLIDALNQQFPDYLFVLDFSASAGTDSYSLVKQYFDSGKSYDLLYTGKISYWGMNEGYFVDLSTESFLDDYLLSSLNDISHNGHIYAIPGPSTVGGMAYNKDMFAEHGWQVPTTQDEFFALCEEIQAAGITPFASCFKYSNMVQRIFSQMCYSELYQAPKDVNWLYDLQENKATYRGHMEPLYELVKRFADTGVATLDYFTASATQQRQEFWAGKYAMTSHGTAIYQYAETEHAPFEVGMMAYPAKEAANSNYLIAPSYYLAIPKAVEKDPERLALMKEVLHFLSTPEAQQAVLHNDLQISNIKDVYKNYGGTKFDYVNKALEAGSVAPDVTFEASEIPIAELQLESLKSLFEGASVEEAIAQMDESLQQAFAEGIAAPEYETLATAEEDFTMLETSYYIADQLKEAAGAEIGLMINGGYFRSNLAMIMKGAITADLSRYAMKGVTAEDCLTTYRMTGAQLRALLENPIVDGDEVDALIAASGLKIEYAPWNPRGSRVVSLALEDGTALADDQLYTVAAYDGVIAEQYLTDTVQTHAELGAITDILKQSFQEDGTIKPNIKDRVTLIWAEQ